MQAQQIRWQVFPTASQLQDAATTAILKSAENAIAARGRFSIVLAGGTTPKEIYQRLRSAQTDWSKWHIYYGDERCLPVDHADRNSLMAEESWLNHVGIPATQVHPMPAELGPDAGAERYCQALNGADTFDCVLLGMGEDAHTASLFPGQEWDSPTNAPAIPVRNSPKPPADRVSLTAARLSDARQVMFFVTGAGKRDAVGQWKRGEHVPVASIKPACGVDVYIDEAAAE